MSELDVDAPPFFSVTKDWRPDAIAGKLIKGLPEFAHLLEGEARIGWLFHRREIVRGGATVLATVHLPKVQGQLKDVFDWLLFERLGELDFLVLVWADFWSGASAREREILVYHELCHMVHKEDADGEPRFSEDGRPIFGTRAHDVEEFQAVVRRYGAYSEDLQAFVKAAKQGGKQR
jgi:hypothetical protein